MSIILKVQVKMGRFDAARLAADRGIPFAFQAEEKGETVGLVPLAFLPEIIAWSRSGAVRDFAMASPVQIVEPV